MHRSEKFWNKVSKAASPRLTSSNAKIIELSLPFLGSDDQVLDVGCGTGTITNRLAKVVNVMDAIDTSSGMIAIATQQAEAIALPNVNYRRATIVDPQLRENSLDGLLAFNVLPYLQDVSTVMARISTLLKPNGIFISSTACLREKRSGMRYAMRLLTKTRIVPPTNFYRKTTLAEIIGSGNLEIIQTEKISQLPEYFIVARNRK